MPINEYDEILSQPAATPTPGAVPRNEYDDLLAAEKPQQRDILQQNVFVATQSDPEKKAKAMQLSQQMNLPPEFVEQNYDDLAKSFKVQSLPYDRIVNEAPGTAKFMSNPDNAAIAHDDIDNLTQIERGIKIVTSKRGRDSIYSLPSELVNAGKTSLNNLGATAEHVRYAYGLADDSALENIAEFNRRAREATNKSPDYAKEFAKMAEKESGDINKAFNTFLNGYSDLRRGNILQALIDFKKGLHQTPLEALDLVAKSAYRARGLLYSSVEQIANAAPGILGTWAGAAAPVPLPAKPFTMFAGGFLGSGISEVGSQINEQLEKRGYDVTDAASLKKAYSDPALMAEIRGMAERKGITTGAVDALFNMFAGGFSKNLTKGAGMAQKAAAAAADVGVQAVGETAGEFGGQVAREKGDLRKVDLGESIQEGILSLGHGPMEVAKGMRDVPVVSDAQTDTARASADAGVPPGGAAPAGASMRANLHPDPVKAAEQLAISANQAIEAQEGAQALAEIATVLAQSKVEQRVPGKVAELIELAGGPDAHVFYQTDNWDSIWSKKGISPIKAAEALMGDGGKAYHEAKQGSGMLAFPLSQFVTKAGKDENFQEILEEARLKSPGNPSLKEALEIMKQLPATLQELSNEAVAQSAEEAAAKAFPNLDESAKEVRDNIADQLRDQGVDASQAIIHERVFRSLGKRLGVAPMELFNRYKLSVEEARGKVGRTLEQKSRGDWEKEGYTIEVEHDKRPSTRPGLRQIILVARDKNGNEAGRFFTDAYDGEVGTLNNDIQVHAEHQRKGIATALYNKAEALLGRRITPEEDSKLLSDDAKDFWRDRASGKKTFFQSNLPAIKGLPEGVEVSPLGFFSPLEKAVVEMQGKSFPAKDLLGRIKNTPGIKEEELEQTGFADWLAAVDSLKGTQPEPSKWGVVDKTDPENLGGVTFPAKENAEGWIKDTFPGETIGKYEVVEQPDTTNRTGKVTKDEALEFIRQRGLQVEQTVRGEEFEDADSDEDGSPSVANLEWGEIEWSEPDSDSVGEGADSSFDNDFDYELVGQILDKDEYKDKPLDAPEVLKAVEAGYTYFDDYKAAVEELREKYQDGYTDENDKIDEAGLRDAMFEDLRDVIMESTREGYWDRAYEYYSDPDNGLLYGTVTEEHTEWTLSGNDEMGWTSDEAGGVTFQGSLEEAKIKVAQYMIRDGVVSGTLADIISPEDLEWGSPELVSTETVFKVVRKSSYGDSVLEYETFHSKEEAESFAAKENSELAATDPPQQPYYVEEASEELTGRNTSLVRSGVDKHIEKFRSRLEAEAKEWFSDETDVSQERIDDRVKKLAAGEFAELSASVPENFKVVQLRHALIKGTIRGSSTSGYTLAITNPKRSKFEVSLGAQDLEIAKQEAIKHLQDRSLVKRTEVEKLDALSEDLGKPVDINAPTAEALHGSRGRKRPGGKNYREFLLRLPGIPNVFRYTAHFPETNIVAFVRVTERVDENGKRVLFIEELQSDWHQQGRERGYQGEIEPKGEIVHEPENKEHPYAIMIDGVEYNRVSTLEFAQGELEEGIENAKKKGVPNAPYKNTDAWAALAMKRILRVATDEGFDSVAWTQGQVHANRWGTESVGWVKREAGFTAIDKDGSEPSKKAKRLRTFETREKAVEWIGESVNEYDIKEIGPHWVVGSTEQLGGEVDGMNIEEVARQRGHLLERTGEMVTSEEELRNVLRDTLSRERNDRSLESLTKSIWKQMQDKVTGNRKPREEGLKWFYDDLLPNKVVPAILKKLDKNAKVKVEELLFDGDAEKVWKLDLTEEAKENIKKGQSLFQQGPQGPRGFINLLDHEAVMKLTAAKDPSTFFHESGHYYFEVMSRLAADETAPQQIKDDFQEMLRFSGYETVENMRSALDEIAAINAAVQAEGRKPTKSEEARLKVLSAPHEKWADAFMKYIMEGKAPSLALKRAFAKFKVWLISVYRELRNIQVELTPEIRGVMDRLFATDEEIREAQEAMGTEPIFFDAEKAGMSEAQWVRYQQAQADATSAAEEELTAKLMKDFKREQTAQWEGEKNQLKAQIELQVNAQPGYRALSILQNGKLPDGTKVDEIKLDRAALHDKKAFSADMVSKLPKGISEKGGIHPDAAADMLGFPSGQELIKALMLANQIKREDLIDKLAEEAMVQKHGDLLKSERLPDEAIKALHNDKRADLLRMELEHMLENNPQVVKDATKKLIRRMPPKKETREQAQKIIGTNPLGTLKPYMYQRAEIKAAKQAADAWGKGDWGAAFDFKLKELLNHELYRAAVDALDTMEKANEKFKKITRGKDEDLAKSRNMDLVNAARAVLAQFGIGRADKSAQDYLNPMAQYDPDTYETMLALVKSATERVGPLETITYDDFVAMKTAVEALWQLSRDHRQIELDGRKQDKNQAIDELKTELSEWVKGGKPPGFTSSPSEPEKNRMYLLGTLSAFRRVEFWAKQIGPAATRIIWKPVSAASDAYRERQLKERKAYLKLLKSVEKTITYNKISAPELQHEFNGKAELLHAILHRGNESNFRKLLLGYKWATLNPDGTLDTSRWKAFEERMQKEGVLTKLDYDFAQSVWDLLETYKHESQQAHKKMYGHYFNEVTANEFETPYGKYRGGYVPAIADPFLVEDAAVRADKNALEKENNSFMFPTAGRGFTKSRVEGYNAPLALDLRYIPLHIDKVLRFIHIEPTIKEVGRIVMDKNFRAAIGEVNPTWASEMLVPWLQRAAQQMSGIQPQGWWAKGAARFWRGLRKRSSMALLAGNFINASQQLLGVSVAGVNVSKRRLLSALWRYMRQPKQVAETMREIAPEMANRLDGEVFEIQKIMDDMLLNPTKYERAKDFMEKHGSFFSSFAQGMVDTVVFSAAYDQAVARGDNAQQAKEFAHSQVRLSQGSRNPEDVSRFEAGSEFNKAFGGMFYNYFNTMANLMGTEFATAMHEQGLKKGAGRMAYVYMMAMFIPASFGALLVRGLGGEGLDGDDDGEYVDDLMDIFFMSQLKYGAAMIPGIGPAALSTITVFNDKWYDDKISTSPVVSTLENAAHAPFSVYKAITNPGNSKRAVQDVFTAIGLLSGLPTSVVSRPLGYTVDVLEGRVQPSGPVDFTRGLLTGKGKRK